METQAARNLRRSRIQNKASFDITKRLCSPDQRLRNGDLVVVYRFPNQKVLPRAHKLDERWEGPYRIRDEVEDRTYYMLEEVKLGHKVSEK
jgi:hypothetical protein